MSTLRFQSFVPLTISCRLLTLCWGMHFTVIFLVRHSGVFALFELNDSYDYSNHSGYSV